MMQQAGQWLAEQGMTMPDTRALIEGSIALALAAAAIAAGWFIGHRYGGKLAALWGSRTGMHTEGWGPRMCAVLRHASTALLLALAAHGYPWHHVAALLLGLLLGLSVALLTVTILRGLGLHRLAAWTMGALAFVAILSNSVGGLESIKSILSDIGFDIGRQRLSLLTALTIAVTAVALYAGVRLANRVVGHAINQASGFDPTQKLLAQKLAGIAIIVIAFFFGIDLLGIDLTTFTVFSGALGLAVGFGLQKTVGNLIAGIILLMDRSIKPGDVIVVGDSFGWVNKIGVRAVSVVTRDGKEHLIPNENLMTQEVENWSYSDRNVRVRIPVGVSYNCDLKLAQELMMRAAKESPRVLDNPKPNVWLAEFGDSSVNHEILAWIGDPESGVGNVQSDVLNRLWWLFKEHGIEIPFPQRDLNVKSWPSAKAE